MSKPRLMLLVTELQMGGAARVVRDHARAFAERYDVTEVVFDVADGVDFPGEKVPESLGVRGGGDVLTKAANFARRVSRLKKLKRERGIDLCISHLEGAHYVDVLSRSGEKTILCVHGSTIHNRTIRGPVGALRKHVLIPRLYNRADRVVTVSRDLEPELVQLGVDERRLTTINNFFDVETIAERSREPLSEVEQAIFDAGPVVVTAGRLAEQKNQARLLEMIARLRERGSARLVVLGDGPLRGEMIGQSRALGLRTHDAWSGEPLTPDHDVLFLGVRENPFPFMRAADLFVLPSIFEGFPLALGEAMACGACVVAADCPTGPREMLAPESAAPARSLVTAEAARFGMLMPMMTSDQAVEAWAETAARLLDDAGQRGRLGTAARQRMDDFRRERIVGQWFDLIDGLLVEKQPIWHK